MLSVRSFWLGYTAITTLDAAGNFSFDNLPGDTYLMNMVTPGGRLGIAQVVLKEGTSDTVSVIVELR
ncbi:MAG: hypothetical protein V3T61_09865 [Acidobacteriota bacterium]